MKHTYDVIVIGAGQAGLAMGYYLAQLGLDFVILDGSERVGDVWRKRWDSLRLFTPAQYDSLPGLPFPAPRDHYPTKEEVADYLETYALRFTLPVRLRTIVRTVRPSADGSGYDIETDGGRYHASQVVVATGTFQRPHVPSFASGVDPAVYQVHSSGYRSPEELPAGPALVVGGGNSGVQIAAELAATRPTSLSIGRSVPSVPPTFLGRSIFNWLERLGLLDIEITSRIGKRASGKELIVGDSPEAMSRKHGVTLLGRAVGADGTRVVMENGDAHEFATIVWATGYRADFSWIDVPVFNDDRPVQTRGVTAANGLYFLGLPWMQTRGSGLLGWVGRDAEYLATVINRSAMPTARTEAGRNAVLL